jgi:hypothetical protein
MIPGSIVTIIHTRPGLVPRGRLLKAHLKLVFFDGASRAEVVERFGPSRARRSIILDDLGKEQF